MKENPPTLGLEKRRTKFIRRKRKSRDQQVASPKVRQKILLLGIGPIISEALQASEMLEDLGIEIAVASMGTIKPLDSSFLKKCVDEGYKHWITLEEHHKIGGLGSTLLEWLNEQEINNIKLKRMGVNDHFVHQLGDQNYIRKSENLNAVAITRFVQSL